MNRSSVLMEQNLNDLAHQLLQAWNAHNIEGIVELFSTDYEGIDVGEATPQHGPAEVGKSYERYLKAFPDLRVTGETVMEGNRVGLFWQACGTHKGSILNIPPTGRTIEIRGTTFLTFKNGKFVNGLNVWDMAGLLRGMGLLPEL